VDDLAGHRRPAHAGFGASRWSEAVRLGHSTPESGPPTRAFARPRSASPGYGLPQGMHQRPFLPSQAWAAGSSAGA
jgi:hypothetical protein